MSLVQSCIKYYNQLLCFSHETAILKKNPIYERLRDYRNFVPWLGYKTGYCEDEGKSKPTSTKACALSATQNCSMLIKVCFKIKQIQSFGVCLLIVYTIYCCAGFLLSISPNFISKFNSHCQFQAPFCLWYPLIL